MTSILKDYEEDICPYCQFPLNTGNSETIGCPACNKMYHTSCWDENNGCIIYDCTGIPKTLPDEAASKESTGIIIKNDNAVIENVEEFSAGEIKNNSDKKDSAQINSTIGATESITSGIKERKDDPHKYQEEILVKGIHSEALKGDSFANNKNVSKTGSKWHIVAAVFVSILISLSGLYIVIGNLQSNDERALQGLINEDEEATITATIDYKGGKYNGEIVDNKPHGQGKWTHPEEGEYEGDWIDGIKQGDGIFTWPDGRIYNGRWENDKRHGFGVWNHPDGGSYSGEWEDDLVHGYGTRIWLDRKYVGYYIKAKKHGQGIFTYADGSVYDGEWENDKRHGQGKFTLADGSIYDGEWYEDQRHGQGTLIENDEIVYSGQWENDEYLTGDVEIVTINWAVREVEGRYTGEVINGIPNGQGNWRSNGYLYEGQWLDGKRHGTGKLVEPDGQYYLGDWENDMRHGWGTLYYKDGTREFGRWINNRYIE